MKYQIFAACIFLMVHVCYGAEPADNFIKGAMVDIERYENQFAGQTTANPSSVNRSLKLLTLTRQRLDSSPNQSDPSWIEANQRYDALVAHLHGLLEQKQKPASSNATPQPTIQTSPATTQSAAPAQMISQQRVRVKKLLRDINSRFETMDQAGVKPFQDTEYVQNLEQRAQTFRESLDQYAAFADDPDVVAAAEALTKFENMIAFGKQHAAKELEEIGDVQAQIAAAEKQLQALEQPATPQMPFAEGELAQWVTQLATVRNTASSYFEPLGVIQQRAYLPEIGFRDPRKGVYDEKDVDRLRRSILSLVKSIDDELTQFNQNLEANLRHTRESLSFYAEFDPANRDHQSKHFLNAGRADEIRQRLAQDRLNVAEAVQYYQLLNSPALSETQALLDQVESAIERYEAGYREALANIRMPEPASTDRGLLKIARETLASYDYVGEIKRLVINADKVHRKKETSETEIDDVDISLSGDVTLSGTQTTYFYEWEQFQVTTAEPFDNKHYLFYNTLKNYSSGSETTPLNRWIISNRIQGPEIPEDNIDKN